MSRRMVRAAVLTLPLLAAGLLLAPMSLAARKKAEEPAAGKEQKAAAPAAPAGAVAVIGGKAISAEDLEEQAAGRLSRLKAEEYNIKRQVLEDMIVNALLENEAEKRGISVEELTRIEIEGKAPPVTEEEMHNFYVANKARYGDRPESEVHRIIQPGLMQQKVNLRRGEYIGQLRAASQVRVLLEPPRVAVEAGDDPSVGPADAPVLIVEFSDYQ